MNKLKIPQEDIKAFKIYGMIIIFCFLVLIGSFIAGYRAEKAKSVVIPHETRESTTTPVNI